MKRAVHSESDWSVDQTDGQSAWNSARDASDDPDSTDFGHRFYLNYGLDHLHPDLDLPAVLGFLNQTLREDNTLTSARTKKSLYGYQDLDYTRICSFCGMPLTEANYEKLPDGSIRCEACAQNQIETADELQSLYKQMRQEFETLFHVRLPEGLRLIMSPKLEQASGRIFEAPVVRPDDQTPIGAVISGAEGYTIWLRDGISRLSGMLILVCLFTRIWQDQHWDLDHLEELCQKSGQDGLFDAITLGMSEWTGMQMMMLRGEDGFVRQNLQRIQNGPTPKKAGFQLMEKTYPLAHHNAQLASHPFHERVPVDLNRLTVMLENS